MNVSFAIIRPDVDISASTDVLFDKDIWSRFGPSLRRPQRQVQITKIWDSQIIYPTRENYILDK